MIRPQDNPPQRVCTIELECRWLPDEPVYYHWHVSGFSGASEGAANNKARKAGWILHQDGTSSCPSCAARLRKAHRTPRIAMQRVAEGLPL